MLNKIGFILTLYLLSFFASLAVFVAIPWVIVRFFCAETAGLVIDRGCSMYGLGFVGVVALIATWFMCVLVSGERKERGE
jgi:hypothetical protein